MNIEILEKVDIKKITKEVDFVKEHLGLKWKEIQQIGLQGHKPYLSPHGEWNASCGRVTSLQYPENYFKYKLLDIPTINNIMEKYGLVRTRIMKSMPKTCLSMHHDLSKRIHIPVITNKECFMVIEGKTYYLEPGNVYLTNTTLQHTAVNASKNFRIHIVGCMYS